MNIHFSSRTKVSALRTKLKINYVVIGVFFMVLVHGSFQKESNFSRINYDDLNQEEFQNHSVSYIVSDSVSDESIPVLLKRCEGYRGKQGKENVQLPTYSIVEMEYYLGSFRIEETLTRCPTGKKPENDEMETYSIPLYQQNITAEGDENTLLKFHFLRNEVFLLDNGYLSVGINDTAWYYSPTEFCVADIEGTGDEVVLKVRTCEFDPTRPILPKCCPAGTVLGEWGCLKLDYTYPYLDAKSLKYIPMSKANPIVVSPKIACNASERERWDGDECNIVFHPVTDNRIGYIGAHRTWEFLEADKSKCLDVRVSSDGDKHLIMIYCGDNSTSIRDKDKQARISTIYMITMYIGAFFHLLTSTVYIITWSKQNIHGKTLCSCTASLFFMQIFLGTAHLLGKIGNQRNSALCYINSMGGQYFMIAAFTWLLVVNIDLWRTFRSMKAGASKSLKRFLTYSALGWGFPLLVSVISISLEFSFKCRASGVPIPEFGEHYCFVIPWAQGYYVYYILSVLIALSFIFATLTLFGLYSFKKDTGNLRSSKRDADKQNVMLFLKLGVVMGLTWIFEVISWAATSDESENHFSWIILDLYNALSAILIFLFFVCKRTTLNLLEQCVPALIGISAAFAKFTSTFTGESASDHTVSTGVGSGSAPSALPNGKGSKKSIELCAIPNKKEEGSTNNGFD